MVCSFEMPSWKPAASIASGREEVSGRKFDFESSGPEVDAGMPEEELTPIGSCVIPAERVPEAGPTLATAPLQPGLSDLVARLARDLGLGPEYGAPAAQFPPLVPSPADAGRASPGREVNAQTSASTAAMPKLTAKYVRARLLGAPGTTGIVPSFGGTSSRPNSRITCSERSRGGDAPETAGIEAPAHPVGVRNQFQQRGLRRSGREPSSADRGSAPRGTLSLRVAMQGHAGMAEGDDPEVAALRGQGLVVAHLKRAVFPHQGARLPFRSERELRTLAESLDIIIAGRIVAAADLLMQRFRAVEWQLWRAAGGQSRGTWKSSQTVACQARRRAYGLPRLRRSGSCRRSVGSWSRLRQVAARPACQVNLTGETWTFPARWADGSGRTATNRMSPRRNGARRSGARKEAGKSKGSLKFIQVPHVHRQSRHPQFELCWEPMVNYLCERCTWSVLSAPTTSLKVEAIRVEVTAQTLFREHCLGVYHLINRRCGCHCAAHLPCHVDGLLDAFLRLAPRRAAFMRVPKLDGLSLAETGLHLRAHVRMDRLDTGIASTWENGSTTTASGRHSVACYLFRSLFSRQAICGERTCAGSYRASRRRCVAVQLDARWEARCTEGTQEDFGKESMPPSAVQQEAITRSSDDIRDFVRGPPVPAPGWGTVLRRLRHLSA